MMALGCQSTSQALGTMKNRGEQMNLKEIRKDHDRKVREQLCSLTFQEFIIECSHRIEIHKFRRKGKIDYSFSNDMVEI